MSSSKSGSRPTGPSKDDLQPEGLKRLLNQEVVSMRRVDRPLGIFASTGFMLPKLGVSHSGTEVVTADDKHWLVHKGPKYGRQKGGETVVTDAKNMLGAWKSVGHSGDGWTAAQQGTRVTDVVKAGGKDYNLFTSNCHDARINATKKN